jgi:ankyrin repeat protein
MHNNNFNKFARACVQDRFTAARLLRESPEYLTCRHAYLGETILHYLCVANELEAVQWLYSKGAETNTISMLQTSALQDALRLGHYAICEFLLTHGANLYPFNGEPLVFSVIPSANPALLALLATHGANLQVLNQQGRSLLHISASHDAYLPITQYLLAQNFSVNLPADDGFTPLHEAVLHGSLANLEYLLAQGANLNLTDQDGLTPLSMAKQLRHYPMVNWLEQYLDPEHVPQNVIPFPARAA